MPAPAAAAAEMLAARDAEREWSVAALDARERRASSANEAVSHVLGSGDLDDEARLLKEKGTPAGEATRSVLVGCGGDEGPGEPLEPIRRRWRTLRPREGSEVEEEGADWIEAAAAMPRACWSDCWGW